jgi:hypothetical protein
MDRCQQKVAVQEKVSEQCCCKQASDQKPAPAKKKPCPKHGACDNSLRDWAKPTVPSRVDSFNCVAYLLPFGLTLASESSNLLEQINSERSLSPPLHVQNCVWRC